MFNNIGSKLKTVAQVFAWLGIGASALIGIIVMAAYEAIFLGLIIIAFGCLGSWLSSLAMYGFGHLIENTDKLVSQQKQPAPQKKTQLDDIEANLPQI